LNWRSRATVADNLNARTMRQAKNDSPPSLGERMLLALSRSPDGPDYPTTTAQYTLGNALEFVKKTIPNFVDAVRDKTVLDFGCGPGWQAVAMYKECRARRVVGVDIKDTWLNAAKSLAEAEGCSGEVTFGREVPAELHGRFDVAFSIGSFEHFSDPAASLEQMRNAVRPGGSVVVTFAEPWLSHSGAHMSFFTKVPWVNIWFSEKTVLRVRERFRNDGATRYEEVESGLNRMTLAKFERIIAGSGMSVKYLKCHATKGLPLVDKLPLLRELLVGAVTCTLRRD